MRADWSPPYRVRIPIEARSQYDQLVQSEHVGTSRFVEAHKSESAV